MAQIHLWPEETMTVDGSTTVSVTLEQPEGERTRLWYRLPVEYGSSITPSCDPFVVATLMLAMRQSADVVVHGQVSPSLLRNLMEFQAAWVCWRPHRYHLIELTAEVEQELTPTEDATRTLVAFSGGVDSCFTLFRHRTGRCGRPQRNIQGGLMVVNWYEHNQKPQAQLDRAAQKSQQMLESLGVPLIPMATNFRDFPQDWEETHGTAIASCLMLLQGGYGGGLIASTEPYQALIPWGSNPVTDHLLSSHSFQLIHDGAAFTRIQKVAQIGDWSEALRGLQVCWQGQDKDRNCGRCEKCVRTILNFRVVGLSLPECFEQDVTDRAILSLRGLNPLQIAELEQILRTAQGKSISASWVDALSQCIQTNKRLRRLNQVKDAVKGALSNSMKTHRGKR